MLGSFALAEQDAGGTALILTGDRDMFQCVNDRCTVLYLRTGGRGADVVDEAGVRKRYGVPPALVPDLIALRGDPSDGIPGARGIGDKTAADLLRRHGSLEGAIAAWAGESPRVRAALHGQADELRDFKEVATLRRSRSSCRPTGRPTSRAAGGGTRPGHEPARRAARA